MLTTWRKELTECMAIHGESLDEPQISTFSDGELDEEFDPGFGENGGCSFTLWTALRVYFPLNYDGAMEVRSISRHPDGRVTRVGCEEGFGEPK